MNIMGVEMSIKEGTMSLKEEIYTNKERKILVSKKRTNTISKTQNKLYMATKRTFDIFCSILGIFAMLPVMLFVKISYLLSGDKNSIFYTQERIGKNGKIIHMYKFRTMVSDADIILKELLKDEKYAKEWKKNQKLDNDPRITKAGNILRKTSLDELPQFINILKGDMSIIGPRPLVIGELDSHNGNHEIYEAVRPGLSSWWACNGRSATTYEKRLELEYYYVNNMSLLLDIKCILLTIKAVFEKTGAK